MLDEAAVAEALRSGRLGGAALDVFAEEPLPAGSPLDGAPNLLATPPCRGCHRAVQCSHQLAYCPRGGSALVLGSGGVHCPPWRVFGRGPGTCPAEEFERSRCRASGIGAPINAKAGPKTRHGLTGTAATDAGGGARDCPSRWQEWAFPTSPSLAGDLRSNEPALGMRPLRHP